MQLRRTALGLVEPGAVTAWRTWGRHQAADGPFLGRNLRHREGVSSNYRLPATDRYLGIRGQLAYFRTRGAWSL